MVEENKQTVYIETSVVSYLIARPSGDLLAAACQKITVDWWETQRTRFELCTSRVTYEPGNLFPAKPVWRNLKVPDELIKELWQVKDDLAREHGYDVRSLAAYLQEKERREASESAHKRLCSGPEKAVDSGSGDC